MAKQVQIVPTVTVEGIDKFGENNDIDVFGGGEEDLVTWGGLVYWPSSVIAAANIDIVSTSAEDDDTTGTGAHQLWIQGLDANFFLQSETVDLDGLTTVHPVNDYIRIFRARCLTAGTTLKNQGDITVKHTTNTLAMIRIGEGQTKQAAFTVPVDWGTGQILRYFPYVSSVTPSNDWASIALAIRYENEAWHDCHDMRLSNAGYEYKFIKPYPVPPKTDIRLRCYGASSDNLAASGSFFVEKID